MEDIENSRRGHIAVVPQNMPRFGECSRCELESIFQGGHDLGASGVAHERADVVQGQTIPGKKVISGLSHMPPYQRWNVSREYRHESVFHDVPPHDVERRRTRMLAGRPEAWSPASTGQDRARRAVAEQ